MKITKFTLKDGTEILVTSGKYAATSRIQATMANEIQAMLDYDAYPYEKEELEGTPLPRPVIKEVK